MFSYAIAAVVLGPTIVRDAIAASSTAVEGFVKHEHVQYCYTAYIIALQC
jgi:hypothetical protein